MLYAVPFQLCIRINWIGPKISGMIGIEKDTSISGIF
jgi:hypothetical protein